MRLSAILICRTLKVLFDNNKAAYARMVKMDRSNLGKIVHYAEQGVGNAKLMERTVEMCVYTGQETVEFLLNFIMDMAEKESSMRCGREETIARIMARLDRKSERLDWLRGQASVRRKARELIAEVERVSCGRDGKHAPLCRHYRPASDGAACDMHACPFKKLEEFIDLMSTAMWDRSACVR